MSHFEPIPMPIQLVEDDSDRVLPPAGGLVIAMALSLCFWVALAFLIL